MQGENVIYIIIESDSLAMVNILEGRWEVPLSVVLEVSSIERLMESITARVQHSFREGNVLTDLFFLLT